ncbi:hypothetical protein LWI29_036923 [Acer saccharum]|uniref:Uncharacterized protein n=1 Tax=Acer saccharum TaxID=4024 RepID=A0AA39TC26_ACESA|nr:hypothetical protein LWI29_036923 [Acer saccharum]
MRQRIMETIKGLLQVLNLIVGYITSGFCIFRKVVLMGQSKLHEIDAWIRKFWKSIDVSRSGYESDFVTSLCYELG